MRFRVFETQWPGDFRYGEAVININGERPAHVMAFPPGKLQAGHVAIMYDDEVTGQIVEVPADDLSLRPVMEQERG